MLKRRTRLQQSIWCFLMHTKTRTCLELIQLQSTSQCEAPSETPSTGFQHSVIVLSAELFLVDNDFDFRFQMHAQRLRGRKSSPSPSASPSLTATLRVEWGLNYTYSKNVITIISNWKKGKFDMRKFCALSSLNISRVQCMYYPSHSEMK